MKDNCKRLIKIMLSDEEWFNAGYLANVMGVSERSIKNYISEINSFEKDLILSSRKGYQIDSKRGKAFIQSKGRNIPQNAHERINYIIIRILSNDTDQGSKTDLYSIADEIYVSFETIKKDMYKVRKKFMEHDLYLTATNSFVAVEGNELDKRKALSSILYEEFTDHVMSIDVIKNIYPLYDLELLQKIIETKCEEYHYFINEYALINLILDIIIGIDRMKKEKTFEKEKKDDKRIGIREQELARNIATEIEHHFGVTYSITEFEELTIILLSHLMKMDFNAINKENLELMVGSECVNIVKQLSDILKNTYFVDIDNVDFIIKFTLHIKNMLVRLRNGYRIKNPLVNHIKNTCPLIFECAVEVSNKIHELTDFDLSEDEIGYIALHIGGNLETQKSKRKVISCVILYPQYYDFSNKMMEEINNHYQKQLEIKTVITSLNEIKNLDKTDLIISTIPITELIRMEAVIVTPFLNEKDYKNISGVIEKIILRKKKARLKQHLMQISNPLFFYKNKEFEGKEEAISFMVDIMQKEGYVNSNFEQEIFEREKQSSTAFEHIAVPHSMYMNANKTGMFVLLNEKKPINWNDNFVSIVMMFAISREERAIFHDVYDNLIVLLIDKPNAVKVLESAGYIDFIESVISCFS
ncbi:BglG family transcription antiterminator [Lacrimispora sp. AGF001]|uniref:BglG family transcription antiterminator n=1 Tax=Lacrimispora sp. AGF001 TaxID=3401631 RepID=UPI003B431A66